MKISQSKTGHVYTEIELPEGYTGATAREIGEELINFVIDRSKNGKGKDGKSFPKYSKAYINSVEFELAGKSADEIDLTLSSETLDSMTVLEATGKRVKIGFEEGDSRNNGVAEGNIIGSYGQSSGNSKKARNFLDLSSKEVSRILDQFPVEKQKEDVASRKAIRERASQLVNEFDFDLGGE